MSEPKAVFTETPQSGSQTTFSSASLYVGDLATEVSEAILFEKFSAAGPVLSIRVCRDSLTRRSLGYAYVNFQKPADAEVALNLLNYDVIKGRPIRIMRSQRNPSLRKSGLGNIFVKNLDKQIDNKALYDTFAAFGNILSCKVEQESVESDSKGYGFVHFETEESALRAIQTVNGMFLKGKQVFVGKFVARTDREKELSEKCKHFTNVFVKNFPHNWTEDDLHKIFSKYGKITSLKLSTSEDGKSKCFGFVSFEEAEQAEAAVNDLNGKEIEDGGGKKLFVSRAQKKAARNAELTKRFNLIKMERMRRNAGVNVFVKNLEDSIDDDKLREEFSTFGTVTSAKVMKEFGRSKGFGFVCFSKPEEASSAVSDMNGKILVTKPLYVNLAQDKEERKTELTAQFNRHMASLSSHQTSYLPNTGILSSYVPQSYRFASSSRQSQGHLAPGIFRPIFHPRFPQQLTQRSIKPLSFQQPRHSMPAQLSPASYRYRLNVSDRYSASTDSSQISQNSIQIRPGSNQSPHQPMSTSTLNIQNNGNAEQLSHQTSQQGIQNSAITERKSLTSILAAAKPHEQRQILGERLYPKVLALCPQFVSKVTGMLLEMENGELIHVLHHREALVEKVSEALNVLEEHRTKNNNEE